MVKIFAEKFSLGSEWSWRSTKTKRKRDIFTEGEAKRVWLESVNTCRACRTSSCVRWWRSQTKLRRRMAIDNDVANAGLAGAVKCAQPQPKYYVVSLAPQKVCCLFITNTIFCLFLLSFGFQCFLHAASGLTSFGFFFLHHYCMFFFPFLFFNHSHTFCQNHLILHRWSFYFPFFTHLITL